MRSINNKGFTLVELIATLVILSLVMGIGAVSVTKIINNSKEKDYKLLLENIKNAAEEYYIECKYSPSSGQGDDYCKFANNQYEITLQGLVNYGFLKGNEVSGDDKFTIVDPTNSKDISNCTIIIAYDGLADTLIIQGKNYDGCPLNPNGGN